MGKKTRRKREKLWAGLPGIKSGTVSLEQLICAVWGDAQNPAFAAFVFWLCCVCETLLSVSFFCGPKIFDFREFFRFCLFVCGARLCGAGSCWRVGCARLNAHPVTALVGIGKLT
jgi:hypothetical protein